MQEEEKKKFFLTLVIIWPEDETPSPRLRFNACLNSNCFYVLETVQPT